MFIRFKNKKAFTLIEVLVTSIIGAIVAMGTVFVLSMTYRITTEAVAINSNNTTLKALHDTFNYTIRNAKSLSRISATELKVTPTTGSVKTITFVGGKVKIDGADVNIINMANVTNQVLALSFTEGTPKEKTVGVDLSITTNYSGNKSITSKFNSSFYCRNN